MISRTSEKNKILRCPECETGMLITPGIMVRVDTTKRLPLPVKTCRRCKIVLLHEKTWASGWKIWNMTEYVHRPV